MNEKPKYPPRPPRVLSPTNLYKTLRKQHSDARNLNSLKYNEEKKALDKQYTNNGMRISDLRYKAISKKDKSRFNPFANRTYTKTIATLNNQSRKIKEKYEQNLQKLKRKGPNISKNKTLKASVPITFLKDKIIQSIKNAKKAEIRKYLDINLPYEDDPESLKMGKKMMEDATVRMRKIDARTYSDADIDAAYNKGIVSSPNYTRYIGMNDDKGIKHLINDNPKNANRHMLAAKQQELGLQSYLKKLKNQNEIAKTSELGKIRNKKYFFKANTRRARNIQAIENKYAELNRTRRSKAVKENPYIGIFNTIEHIDELKIRYYRELEKLDKMRDSMRDKMGRTLGKYNDLRIQLHNLKYHLALGFIKRLLVIYNNKNNTLMTELDEINYKIQNSFYKYNTETGEYDEINEHFVDSKKRLGTTLFTNDLYKQNITKLKNSYLRYSTNYNSHVHELLKITADPLLSYLIDKVYDQFHEYSTSSSTGNVSAIGSTGFGLLSFLS